MDKSAYESVADTLHNNTKQFIQAVGEEVGIVTSSDARSMQLHGMEELLTILSNNGIRVPSVVYGLVKNEIKLIEEWREI